MKAEEGSARQTRLCRSVATLDISTPVVRSVVSGSRRSCAQLSEKSNGEIYNSKQLSLRFSAGRNVGFGGAAATPGDMSPNYKLLYFNARGRAEHIRFIFAYAGIEYEDARIPREKWPEVKKKMPFGMLPVLEIDGKAVAQSNAVARYLAKQYGLAGTTEWEALECDVLVDTLGDLKQVLAQFRMEQDTIKKEEKKARLMRETIPFYLSKFEKIVSENNGFSVGTDITWCDFVFAVSLENFEHIFGKAALDQYPALKALKIKVYNIPSINAWVSRRPATES